MKIKMTDSVESSFPALGKLVDSSGKSKVVSRNVITPLEKGAVVEADSLPGKNLEAEQLISFGFAELYEGE